MGSFTRRDFDFEGCKESHNFPEAVQPTEPEELVGLQNME
jgi:hypothetical protein